MSDVSVISVVASVLVILSIVFGSVSFRFNEEGAPPDEAPDPFAFDVDHDEEIIVRGKRRRKRMRVRLFFNLGALCLLSSVPLGYANARDPRLSSIFVFLALAIVVGAGGYVGANLRNLWLDQREDGFSAWYVGKRFAQFYRNGAAQCKLFFAMNRMRFSLPSVLFERDWEKRLI